MINNLYLCNALLDWYTFKLFVGILLRYHLHSNIVMLTRVTLGAYIDIVTLLNCPKLDWNLIEQQRARWVASQNIRQLDLFDSQEGLFLETRT